MLEKIKFISNQNKSDFRHYLCQFFYCETLAFIILYFSIICVCVNCYRVHLGYVCNWKPQNRRLCLQLETTEPTVNLSSVVWFFYLNCTEMSYTVMLLLEVKVCFSRHCIIHCFY